MKLIKILRHVFGLGFIATVVGWAAYGGVYGGVWTFIIGGAFGFFSGLLTFGMAIVFLNIAEDIHDIRKDVHHIHKEADDDDA